MYNGKKIGLFLPTRNGEDEMKLLMKQVVAAGELFDEKFAIDTESVDSTVSLLKKADFQVQTIEQKNFTHGRVRKFGLERLRSCDYVVMVTQDIQPTANAFIKLIQFIDKHKNMASAYGRQLVDEQLGTIYEARSRQFNYPEKELVKSKNSIAELGIKTIFQSDAFVVYDVKIVQQLGSFPEEIQFSEDQYLAACAILGGYTVGYAAGAIVYHQHNYTLRQEYDRFQLAGWFHQKYQKLLSPFGTNEKEGIRYVVSELNYYFHSGNKWKIPRFLAICVAKFIGYKMGKKRTIKNILK